MPILKTQTNHPGLQTRLDQAEAALKQSQQAKDIRSKKNEDVGVLSASTVLTGAIAASIIFGGAGLSALLPAGYYVARKINPSFKAQSLDSALNSLNVVDLEHPCLTSVQPFVRT